MGILGSLAAGAIMMPASSIAAAARRAADTPGIIDTHHHFMSPAYAKSKGAIAQARASNSVVLDWSPEISLEAMDKSGVNRAILSLPSGAWFGDVAEGRKLAREVNEFAAAACARYPDRLGFFASIPLPDADGSLAEIAYAFDHLKAAGVMLKTNYDGKYLGDESFFPVYEELNRRAAVVYMHPTICYQCEKDFIPELPNPYLEFVFDSTRTAASLLFTGTLARTRKMKWLFSHGGGTLPMVAGRISGYAALHPEMAQRFPDGPKYELQRLFYDTANVTHADSFAALRAMVPPSQIVFGSDFPYLKIDPQIEALRSAGLDRLQLSNILGGNAQRIMSV